MLLVPLRWFVVPRLGFTEEELGILDGAVASEFVSCWLKSVLIPTNTMPDYGVCGGISLKVQ